MKRTPITFTSLHSKAIFDKLEQKKAIVAHAFCEAADDKEMNVECELWDTCVGDGLDETNAYQAR